MRDELLPQRGHAPVRGVPRLLQPGHETGQDNLENIKETTLRLTCFWKHEIKVHYVHYEKHSENQKHFYCARWKFDLRTKWRCVVLRSEQGEIDVALGETLCFHHHLWTPSHPHSQSVTLPAQHQSWVPNAVRFLLSPLIARCCSFSPGVLFSALLPAERRTKRMRGSPLLFPVISYFPSTSSHSGKARVSAGSCPCG